MSERYPQVEVSSVEELRQWLTDHHDTVPGIWLVTYKKAVPERYVPYEQIVREALCFGWIDGQARGVDERRSSLLLTPRRPKSGWSRPNKLRVAELVAEGRMTPAGQAVIDRAVASGTWTALDDVEDLVEPAELRTALDAVTVARTNWDAFPRSARRAALEWISTAKRPETRARRVAEVADLAAENVRWGQPQRPKR